MINNLKELQALLKLCRKQGVTEITLGGTVIKFGDLPRKETDDAGDKEPDASDLTDEQLMFFSAGGTPP